jgi:hypothetical protein
MSFSGSRVSSYLSLIVGYITVIPIETFFYWPQIVGRGCEMVITKSGKINIAILSHASLPSVTTLFIQLYVPFILDLIFITYD